MEPFALTERQPSPRRANLAGQEATMTRSGMSPADASINRRSLVVIALMTVALAVISVAVGALLAATPAPASARAATASLTIRARACPPRYIANAHAADCDEPFGFPVRYLADGPTPTSAETDDAGNARFAALLPGAYAIGEGDIPFDFIDRLVVACALSATPATPVPFTATTRGLRLALDPGADITCDLYYVGTDARALPSATLAIHHRLCPAGFQGPNYDATCHATPAPAGIEFALDGPDAAIASTDAAGNTALRVAAGRYTVRGGLPGEFATLAVFCAPASQPGTPFPFTPLGAGVRGPDDLSGIQLDLAPDAHILCDWFNTPEDLR